MSEEQIKRRIRIAFERAGKTQQQIADEMGVSQPAVSSWLRSKGGKMPDPTNRAKLASVLGTTDAYFTGEQDLSLASREPAVRLQPEWVYDPVPPSGARDYGNPAMYAFTPTVETLVKEGLQNVLDVSLPGLPAEARFRLIHLAGANLDDFRQAIQWHDLSEHLKASGQNRQKIGNIIRAGLERDKSLVLLALDDFNTAGMIGEDHEDEDEANNFFVALGRDTLNSAKFSQSAGGSFGLGKAVFTRVSQFATVLFNSNLSQPTRDGAQYNRIFGRTDLAYHVTEKGKFAGPGWFGIRQPDGDVLSYFGDEPLAQRLYLDRGDRSGTTILVVGYIDASEGDRSTPNLKDLASEIEQATVKFFWPAITSGKLSVSVETYEGHDRTSESTVNPKQLAPEFVELLERGRAGEVNELLQEEGDIVQFAIPLHVPRRRVGGALEKHADIDHEAALLVRRSSGEASELARSNLAVFRGKEMVIKYIDLSRFTRFAVPFEAVLMCGEAAGSSAADRFAEEFLRTAEPPMHDDWAVTQEMGDLYYRGGGKAIKDMFDAAREKIREAVKMDFDTGEDGPRALSDLFKIGKPSQSRTLLVTDVRRVPKLPERIQVTVRVPLKDADWTTRPIVLCKTETGADLQLGAKELEAVRGATVKGDRLLIGGKVREAVFHLTPEWHSRVIESDAMANVLRQNGVLSVELRDVKD